MGGTHEGIEGLEGPVVGTGLGRVLLLAPANVLTLEIHLVLGNDHVANQLLLVLLLEALVSELVVLARKVTSEALSG